MNQCSYTVGIFFMYWYFHLDAVKWSKVNETGAGCLCWCVLEVVLWEGCGSWIIFT
jgi:hypothetical protein